MKRYLYLIIALLGTAIASCEPSTYVGLEEHKATFDLNHEIIPTETSFTLTMATPTYSVNDKATSDFSFGIAYRKHGSEEWIEVVESTLNNNKHTYNVTGLVSETTYDYCMWARHANTTILYPSDNPWSVTTLKHEAVCEFRYLAEVEAKGVMATLNLRDIAYMVDGNEEDIHILRVEYTPANMEAWAMQEYAPHKIVDGTLSVALPFTNKDYLTECSNYDVRLTLYPANSDYAPITANIERFTTTTAEVSATIPMPRLTLDAKSIAAYVEGLEIFYDGVSEHYYTSPYATTYQFRYRMAGTEEWSLVKVGAKHGKMEATLVLWDYADDTTYEVQAMVIAGADGETLYSDVATIKTPAVPTPPPVVGDGDTAAIAGTWHLTTWRGAEPSFDIYLSITEDGVVSLWQRLTSREWELYYSTATIVDGIIHGTYTDGTPWSTSYSITIGNDTMTWVAETDSSDVSVYTRCELPEGLPTSTAITRSATGERFL